MVRTTPTNAGGYDRRIRIEINTATDSDRDKNNAKLEIWTESYFDTMAAFQAEPSRAGGAEYEDANKRVVEDKALFRVRYDDQTSILSPATARVRDIDSGRVWNIQRSYDPTGRHVEIHLEVNAIV